VRAAHVRELCAAFTAAPVVAVSLGVDPRAGVPLGWADVACATAADAAAARARLHGGQLDGNTLKVAPAPEGRRQKARSRSRPRGRR
jgi:RNA recognition motif-containing protein